MRQAQYVGQRSIVVADAGDPGLSPGYVKVEVAFTGICGTDLHIFHGEMDARVGGRAVLGHEMSGRIAAVGPGVSQWRVGDAVSVMPLQWCGECLACRSGNSHVCERLNFMGIDSPGSMQQHWAVPEGTLIRLPSDLPLDQAALVEPTAVAVHDVGRAQVKPGEKTLVVGGGPIGLLIAVVARELEADVLLVEPDDYRRGIADSLSLATVDPTADDGISAIEAWAGSGGAACAFEVSGVEEGLALAIRCLAVRGRLCLVAVHTQPRNVDIHRFFWRELSMVGARLYVRSDFERAVELVASGVVPTDALISKVVTLGTVTSGFQALESKKHVMKVLVDCQAYPNDDDVPADEGLAGTVSC